MTQITRIVHRDSAGAHRGDRRRLAPVPDGAYFRGLRDGRQAATVPTEPVEAAGPAGSAVVDPFAQTMMLPVVRTPAPPAAAMRRAPARRPARGWLDIFAAWRRDPLVGVAPPRTVVHVTGYIPPDAAAWADLMRQWIALNATARQIRGESRLRFEALIAETSGDGTSAVDDLLAFAAVRVEQAAKWDRVCGWARAAVWS